MRQIVVCDRIFTGHTIYKTVDNYRGDAFGRAFAEIGTLQSILPKSVDVLALTATATYETMDCVIQHLSMKKS